MARPTAVSRAWRGEELGQGRHGAPTAGGDESGRPTAATLLGGKPASTEPPESDRYPLAWGDEGALPPRGSGTWRIELRYLPIGHRGHAYLVLKDASGKARDELNGMAKSRHTGKVVESIGVDGAHLTVTTHPKYRDGHSQVADVAVGSYDQIVRGTWARGLQAAREIIDKKLDYKSHDPSYEAGTDGGEIQNSNSVAYTLGRAMGLDLDSALRSRSMERRFSGWNRNLLDPGYKPYRVPPLFGVKEVP